ncbi:MAG: hypothetical protein HY002_11795 [Candidatus Rokubacteria bacterium]|nr:hypothetical protein [Candidatus Rokubacteria bacterium]
MASARRATRSRGTKNPDGTRTEYFEIRPSEEGLLALIRELFEHHWDEIIFGPSLQGAVFEIQFAEQPHIGYLDGYLTIGPRGPDSWHFHLCVGPHRGSASRPTSPELAAWRRCARAAFYRDFDPAGRCGSWGFRMWNGKGEQMITIWFPNPWLDPKRRAYVETPDWARLDLWMRLRERYAGLPAEPPPVESDPPQMH